LCQGFACSGVPCGGNGLVMVSMVIPHGGKNLYPEWVPIPRGLQPRKWFACETWSLRSGLPVRLEVEVFARGCKAWWAGSWAQSAHRSCACERDKGLCRVLNATALVVTFRLPLFGGLRLHGCRVSRVGQGLLTSGWVGDGHLELWQALLGQGRSCCGSSQEIRHFGVVFGVFSPQECRAERGKRREFVFFAEGGLYGKSRERFRIRVSACEGVGTPCRDKVATGRPVVLRSVSSVLDTLTPVFELYVRLRERRQREATCVCGCAVACSALVIRGVVLVGLHCSLTCAYGAAVGPFVRDCETER
ncbi:hypothetical protein Taro_002558, partial [Colocasia esculenta]|nr:hypothetical protein [Colocasia esculenta]